MAPAGERGARSAEEREAARRERERRRAERRGEALVQEPEVAPAEPAVAPQPEQEPSADEPQAALDSEATQAWDIADEVAAIGVMGEQGSVEDETEGVPDQMSPATEEEASVADEQIGSPDGAEGVADEAWDPHDAEPAPGEPEPEPFLPDEPPAPDTEPAEQQGPTRARWRPRGAADQLPVPPPPAGGSGTRPPRRRQPRSGGQGASSFRARAGAVAALVVVAIVVWLVVLLVQHLSGSKSKAPQASHPPVAKVVIPEGESRSQIAAIARKDGLTGDYMKASTHSSAIQPKRFGAPAGIPNLEGFLFPATYEVPVHSTAKALVEQQLEAFQERFGPEEQRHAKALHVTPYQMLIVASMIEREAYLQRDRPLVAAVIYNRLRINMPLGIDSTIRFALNDYSKPLTEAQLRTPSPYNTRLHKGLPPTPISNPGMEAIEAAARPAHVGYLYYVDGADGCGDLVFSDTNEEFEAHKRAYDEALAANGGRTPTCKRK